MNLTVRTEYRSDYDPEGTIAEITNATRLIAAVHPDFKEEVMLSIENEDYPTVVSIQIESLGINWSVGTNHAFANWSVMESMPIEEACAKIRELTSPKVDQPAPKARTAADAKVGDAVWVRPNKIVWVDGSDIIIDTGEVFDRRLGMDGFGTTWGFIEGHQP